MSAEGSVVRSSASEEGGFQLEPFSVADVPDLVEMDDMPLWPEGYYPVGYVFGQEPFSGESYTGVGWDEGVEVMFAGEQEEQQEEEEEELFSSRIPSYISSGRRKQENRRSTVAQETRRKSVFMHSWPSNFPDVLKAPRSAFGSILLRTSSYVTDETDLLKSVTDSSYNMLQSLLESFEKIISVPTTDDNRKQMTLAFKESVLKALEMHGIRKTFSDGSVHWNIYPITQNYLFSLQIGDNLHQTRLLSRVEDRILNGPMEKLKLPYAWPTDSVWTGPWDAMGMAGIGTYNMPHGVSYNGRMQDGMFQDYDAMLTYPNQFKALHCVFEKGKLQSCQFQFPDFLMHKTENWEYCQFPDRRFWSEVRKGLKPAKIAQKTERDPPRSIPRGCYDTGDGFFDPVSLMLTSPMGELLRVPVCEEVAWIKKYCRKGFLEHTKSRPDLYENWFNYDYNLINSILEQQEKYRNCKITYEELREFYSSLGLLPRWLKYAKREAWQLAMQERLKTIPSVKKLKKPRVGERQGHKIPSSVIAALNEDLPVTHRIWKTDESKSKITACQSKISRMSTRSQSVKFSGMQTLGRESEKELTERRRPIPEKFMRRQPIIRPPFQMAPRPKPPDLEKPRKKCSSRGSSSTYSEEDVPRDAGNQWEKKDLKKFMKKMIMGLVWNILLKERERHRQRLAWARKPTRESGMDSPPLSKSEKHLKVLSELLQSIPEREEFCDSDSNKVMNLKEFAQDKFEVLKYWGKRIFTLDFDEGNSD